MEIMAIKIIAINYDDKIMAIFYGDKKTMGRSFIAIIIAIKLWR